MPPPLCIRIRVPGLFGDCFSIDPSLALPCPPNPFFLLPPFFFFERFIYVGGGPLSALPLSQLAQETPSNSRLLALRYGVGSLERLPSPVVSPWSWRTPT